MGNTLFQKGNSGHCYQKKEGRRLGRYNNKYLLVASQVVLVAKNLPASAGDARDMGSIPG